MTNIIIGSILIILIFGFTFQFFKGVSCQNNYSHQEYKQCLFYQD